MFSLVYDDPSGNAHRVPPGFRTDFNSLPRPLRGLFFTLPSTHAAAALHDYHYRVIRASRRWADDLFFHALRASRVNPVSARIYWLGVRLAGWWAYRKNAARTS